MSIFKEVVEDRIEDPTERLTRLTKYTDGDARGLIKLCVQQPTHLGYQNAKMLLENTYEDPHRIYASCRKEIKNWSPIKYGDAKQYQDFFAFLDKCNSLGAATKWNATETPDTLCMLVLKSANGVADRCNRKALVLKRSQQREPSLKDFIEFFDEETVLVNNPIFSRETITAYVGTKEKSNNPRKR